MNAEVVLIRIKIFVKAKCFLLPSRYKPSIVYDAIGEDVVTGKQSQGCYFYYDNNEKETHVFDLS